MTAGSHDRPSAQDLAGQIAIMHTELVERRRWISERRFLHALNYCMLLPGPEAQQLAIYIGWLMHRTWGGILAGVLFVLPSLLILIGLSWVYIAFGDVPAVEGLWSSSRHTPSAPGHSKRMSTTRSTSPSRPGAHVTHEN